MYLDFWGMTVNFDLIFSAWSLLQTWPCRWTWKKFVDYSSVNFVFGSKVFPENVSDGKLNWCSISFRSPKVICIFVCDICYMFTLNIWIQRNSRLCSKIKTSWFYYKLTKIRAYCIRKIIIFQCHWQKSIKTTTKRMSNSSSNESRFPKIAWIVPCQG